MNVVFKFDHLQYVRIILHDVKYNGRVNRCIHDGGQPIYQVNFIDDKGDFQLREFYEDELLSL